MPVGDRGTERRAFQGRATETISTELLLAQNTLWQDKRWGLSQVRMYISQNSGHSFLEKLLGLLDAARLGFERGVVEPVLVEDRQRSNDIQNRDAIDNGWVEAVGQERRA